MKVSLNLYIILKSCLKLHFHRTYYAYASVDPTLPQPQYMCQLSIPMQQITTIIRNLKYKIYYLTLYISQKSGYGLTGKCWLSLSHKVETKVSSQAMVSTEALAEGGSTSNLLRDCWEASVPCQLLAGGLPYVLSLLATQQVRAQYGGQLPSE